MNEIARIAIGMASVVATSLLLAGCFAGPDGNGAAHASRKELVGVYRSDAETIELHSDGTYRQYFSEPASAVITGDWIVENSLFRDTTVVVKEALLDRPSNRRGTLRLDVYRKGRQFVLMRNATADWYYTKSK